MLKYNYLFYTCILLLAQKTNCTQPKLTRSTTLPSLHTHITISNTSLDMTVRPAQFLYPELPAAIRVAISNDNVAVVRNFLDADPKNIEATLRNRFERTILMCATMNCIFKNHKGNCNVLKEILSRNPKCYRKDKQNKTAYDLAVQFKCKKAQDMIAVHLKIPNLSKNQPTTEKLNTTKSPPPLTQQKIYPNLPDTIRYALRNDEVGPVKKFLETDPKNVEATMPDGSGRTLLMSAAINGIYKTHPGNYKVLKEILRYFPNLNRLDREQKTVYDLTERFRCKKAQELLVQHLRSMLVECRRKKLEERKFNKKNIAPKKVAIKDDSAYDKNAPDTYESWKKSRKALSITIDQKN